MGRRIGNILLAAALCAALCAPALAAPGVGSGRTDTSYSGELDPRTGLPIGAEQGDGFYVPDSGAYRYDRENRRYINPVGSSSFTSSIPDGAVVSEGQHVSFAVPDGLNGALYRSGNLLADAGLGSITEPGSYLLEVSGSSGSARFTFFIVGKVTNALRELSLPDGFRFDYVRLNGEQLTMEYSNYLQLLEDGRYEVSWSCPDIEQSYTLDFTLDTVAPTLELPEVRNGEAHSEVTLADLAPGDYILLESGGETRTITSATAVLRDAGEYRLTVCDQAGNSTRYDFTIHVYLNLSAAAAIGLVLAGILALLLYCRYIRTHPRVG